MEDALHYNPYGKYHWYFVPAYYAAKRYQEAVHTMKNVHNPTSLMHSWMAVACAKNGDIDGASRAMTQMITETTAKLGEAKAPSSWFDFLMERYPAEPATREHYADGLRLAGLSD